MSWIVNYLWLVAALPITAGGIIAVLKQRQRRLAAALAIGAMSLSLLLALVAFVHVVSAGHGELLRQYVNLSWFQFGTEWVNVGWLLDPQTTVMLCASIASCMTHVRVNHRQSIENRTALRKRSMAFGTPLSVQNWLSRRTGG